MDKRGKQLSNAFSTGGGGNHYEAHIQSIFIALMLTGGHAPCLPSWPIKQIKPQGRNHSYHTDDIIVFVEDEQSPTSSRQTLKLLGQIKHSITFTKSDNDLKSTLSAAWLDFNNTNIFTRDKDCIALITSHISTSDHNNGVVPVSMLS